MSTTQRIHIQLVTTPFGFRALGRGKLGENGIKMDEPKALRMEAMLDMVNDGQDVKSANARVIEVDLMPPSNVQTIDAGDDVEIIDMGRKYPRLVAN